MSTNKRSQKCDKVEDREEVPYINNGKEPLACIRMILRGTHTHSLTYLRYLGLR